jgi:mannosyl-3-phosphoglycerate phosphatase
VSRFPSAVVFTDIDGTLIDHDSYRPGPAAAALARLREAGVEVVLCSAKTSAEQQSLRDELGLFGPFIIENGAAVLGMSPVVVLGVPYRRVRSGLDAAAEEVGLSIRGYGDMTAEEIASRTGLSLPAARRAAARDYSETFVVEGGGPNGEAELAAALERRGLRLFRGTRFHTAAGRHDKGTAIRARLKRFGSRVPPTYGIGDFLNDVDLLEAVEVPMLVARPGGGWAEIDVPDLVRLPGVGPEGWVEAAAVVLNDLERRGRSTRGR